jgi:hypothetical protein
MRTLLGLIATRAAGRVMLTLLVFLAESGSAWSRPKIPSTESAASANAVLMESAKISITAPETLKLVGLIDDKTPTQLKNQVSAKTKKLIVTSPGGLHAAALEMAKIISQYQLEIVVDGICGSACALLLVPAGKSVTVNPRSFIALHWQANEDFDVDAIEGRFPLTAKRWRQILDYKSALGAVSKPWADVRARESAVREFYKSRQFNPTMLSIGMAMSLCNLHITIRSDKTFYNDSQLTARDAAELIVGGTGEREWDVVWVPDIEDWRAAGLTISDANRGTEPKSHSLDRRFNKWIPASMRLINVPMSKADESLCKEHKIPK